MRFATIDIGTNTVLLLVAQPRSNTFQPVVERSEITRLGRGVDRSGKLDEEAITETVAVVAKFAQEARSLGASQIACTTTSAARDAANGQEFLRRVEKEAQVLPEIISGDLEAQLSYESATRDLGNDSPLVVVDIGGGSTEFVYGQGSTISFRKSLDIGSVRLTEKFIKNDPPSIAERNEMQRFIDKALMALPMPEPEFQLVGIAGTVTTVYAVANEIDPYDAQKVHLAKMTEETVRREGMRYFRLPLEKRLQLKGMPSKRADVIAAGTLILERVMVRLLALDLVVSDRGIRWGLLYHRFGDALK